MSDPILNLEIAGGIARVTLNRPQKRNALTRELMLQLAQSVATVRADDSVRLLVLTGAGPVFCAGMDLGQMQARAESPRATDEWQHDTRVYRDLLLALFTLPIPTLAVVPGPALAGGLGLLLACDIVLAAEDAFFSLPEPKRGITAAVIAPLLVYRIGPGSASYLLLSGERVSAADGHRIGLCHAVAGADRLSERERQLIGSILTGAPSSLTKTKQQLISCAPRALFEQLEAGMQISAEARLAADAREGIAAFLETRDPNWFPQAE